MSVKQKITKVLYGIIAIISAAGMRCDLRSKEDLLNDFEKDFSSIRGFFLCFTRSFAKDRIVGLCLALAVVFLFSYAEAAGRKYVQTKKRICIVTLFSLFFGAVQVFCRSLKYDNTFDPLFDSIFARFRTVCMLIGYTTVCFLVVFILFTKIEEFHLVLRKSSESCSGDVIRKTRGWKYALGAFFLVVCWLPYLILFYPGVCNIDTTVMIMQFRGYHTGVIALSAVTGPDITISNHHPFFDTVVFGSFYNLGREKIGNTSLGIFLYGITMLILFGIVFSAFWNYVSSKVSHHRSPLRVLFWFSALFPLFSIYSFSMLKDTMFSFSCLLFTYMLILLADDTEKRLNSIAFCILFIIAGVFLTLTKNQGIYLLALTFPLTLVLLFIDQTRRKNRMHARAWVRISVAFIIPMAFFVFIWGKILLPMWNVAPGGKQEAIGFMFQQTAACLKYHGDDVTKEEKEAIMAVLPNEDIADMYDPEKHDNVKYEYNQLSTPEELRAYYKVWFSMGLRHPKTYILAMLNSCYGYFYISESGGFTYTTFVQKFNRVPMGVENAFVGEDKISFISALQEAVNSIPVINYLFGISTPVWTILFCVAYLLDRGSARCLICTLIGFFSVGVFLICPDNSNGRYVMPLYYIAIVLISVVIYRINFEEQEYLTLKDEN